MVNDLTAICSDTCAQMSTTYVALAVGDETFSVCSSISCTSFCAPSSNSPCARNQEIGRPDGRCRLGGHGVPKRTAACPPGERFPFGRRSVATVDQIAQLLLPMTRLQILKAATSVNLYMRTRPTVGRDQFAPDAHLDGGLPGELAVIVRHAHFRRRGVHTVQLARLSNPRDVRPSRTASSRVM